MQKRGKMEEDHQALKKKYRILILASASIILILIIGAILYFFMPGKSYEEYYNERIKECVADSNNGYYFAMALKTRDTQYCNLIEINKEYCFAIVNQDVSVCNKVSEENKATCIAVMTQKPENCPADDFVCMAQASFDSKYCESIEDEEYRKECKKTVSTNPEDWITDEEMQKCQDDANYYAATESRHVAGCDKIKQESRKDLCKAMLKSI